MINKSKLKKNSIKCLECNSVLVSKYRHDFNMCECPNQAFVDGGLAYIRLGAMDLDKIEELHEYEEVDEG